MLRDWFFAHTYRLRLISVAVLTQIVLLAALLGIGLRHGERLLERQLQARLDSEAVLLKAALAAPLAERNLTALQATLEQMHERGSVRAARLSDASGRTLAQVGEAGQDGRRRAIELAIGHAGIHLGTLRYDIDLGAAEQARRQMTTQALAAGAAALALSILLLFFLALRMMTRLDRLVATTQRIAAGDLAARIGFSRRDEIGRLATAIDEMAAALEREHRELAESERRLRFVLQATRDGVWDWDVARNRSYFSRRFRELLGYDDESEFHRDFRFRDALHPEDRDRALAALHASLDEGRHFDVIYRLRCRDGGWRWFRGRGEPETDETGKVIRVAGSITDITAQREAELALAESERRLHYAVSGSSDIIWDWDLASGRYYISPRFCELLGFGADELPGTRESFLARLHPDDRPRLEEAVARHFRQGEPYDIEYRLRHRDGGWRWFRARGSALRDENGRVLRFAGAVTDIQAQKDAEATIRSLLAEQQALLDNVLVGIVYLENRVILRCNRRFEELFGYGPQEMLGHKTAIFYPDLETYEAVGARAYAAVARGEAYSEELQLRRRDGSLFWALLTGRAIDPARPQAGSVWIYLDIGERKRAEEALQRLNAELERRVEERTAELSAANKELEAFSYSVSHDLVAPLRAIDGFSRMLEEDYGPRLDDQARHYIARVRRATQRTQQLIDDMLALARITRREMRREDVDLSGMAEKILNELKQLQPQRMVRMRIAFDIHAKADAGLVHVLLDNLLRNAWKFTARRAEAVIEFGVLRQDGETVYFVADNGAGFDMKYAGKLFGPFQRLHRPEEFEGTGIGLAIVYRIVQRHGGRIWAEAAPDQGAKFYFTLNE